MGSMEVTRAVAQPRLTGTSALRKGSAMEQDKQALLDAHLEAETNKQKAEGEKNSAVSELEQFKADTAGVEALNAEQNATLTALKDAVKFARLVYRHAASEYDIAKFRAKQAGAIVVERAKAAFIKHDDSPEVKAKKEEIVNARKSLNEILTNEKTIRATFKSEMELVKAEKTKARDAIAALKEELYVLDPASKPAEKNPSSGSASPSGKKRGRKSRFAEKTLSVHPNFANGENPHREGSSIHRSFQAFLDSANQSITYENALATGVEAKDIALLVTGGKLVAND